MALHFSTLGAVSLETGSLLAMTLTGRLGEVGMMSLAVTHCEVTTVGNSITCLRQAIRSVIKSRFTTRLTSPCLLLSPIFLCPAGCLGNFK